MTELTEKVHLEAPVVAHKSPSPTKPRGRRRSPTSSASRSRSPSRSPYRRRAPFQSRERYQDRYSKWSRFERRERPTGAPIRRLRSRSSSGFRNGSRRQRSPSTPPYDYRSHNVSSHPGKFDSTNRMDRRPRPDWGQRHGPPSWRPSWYSNTRDQVGYSNCQQPVGERSGPTERERSKEAGSNPMIPLTERFRRVTNEARRGGVRYGYEGGLAHLVLSNLSKIPLTTLYRQAKEISVVIDRKLSPGALISTETIYSFDPRRNNLVIPRKANEGFTPVFKRPEIVTYKTPDDEEGIVKRVTALMSANVMEQPLPEVIPDGRYPEFSSYYPNSKGYQSPGDRYNRPGALSRLGPVNPEDTPKGFSYFLHDDRERRSFGRRGRPINYSFSREHFRAGHFNNNDDNYSSRNRNSGAFGRWEHDKYQELEDDSQSSMVPSRKSPIHGSEYLSQRSSAMDKDFGPNCAKAKHQSPSLSEDHVSQLPSTLSGPSAASAAKPDVVVVEEEEEIDQLECEPQLLDDGLDRSLAD